METRMNYVIAFVSGNGRIDSLQGHGEFFQRLYKDVVFDEMHMLGWLLCEMYKESYFISNTSGDSTSHMIVFAKRENV